jgi:hypothetical protein
MNPEERTKRLLDEFDDGTSRRSFLGSTLGLFIGCQIPWVAKLPIDKPIEQPKIVLSDYRNYIKLDNGYTIQGPGIKAFEDGKLICADINATRDLKVLRSIIYYKNKLLSDAKFIQGGQYLCNGDTLKITHSMNINFYGKLFTPSDPEWDDVLNRYLRSDAYKRGI